MKKIFFTTALALGLGLLSSQAQTLTGGIKVEANTSNFILSDLDNTKSKLGFGVTAGGYGSLEFTPNFELRPELLLHYKTSKLEQAGVESDYQYFGVEIPLYAVGKTTIGNGSGFVGLGPYAGFGFDAKLKTNSGDIKLYDDNSLGAGNKANRFDFGAGLLVGYEFANKLQINAGYKYGFLNTLDVSGDAKANNQTISLGLGYKF